MAALLAIALLGGWEAYVRLGGIEELILPAPSAIAAALVEDRALLWDNLVVTSGEVLLGIAAALAVGVALAVAIHASPTLRRAVYPLLIASQTIPLVIVAPLVIVWLGFDLAPKVAIVALIAFFPVAVSTLDGFARVDSDLLKLMRTLGATRWQAFRHVEAPAALPASLSGAKIAVAIAVIGAVLAEQAGSSEGLGHLLLQAIPQLETARAYAAVVLLAALALLLFGSLSLLERRLLPHPPRQPQGDTS